MFIDMRIVCYKNMFCIFFYTKNVVFINNNIKFIKKIKCCINAFDLIDDVRVEKCLNIVCTYRPI